MQRINGVGLPSISNSNAGSITAPNSTVEQATRTGVVVVAVSTNIIGTAGVAVGGSGGVAVQVAGSVSVHDIKTRAHIDSGANINPVQTGATGGQSVYVDAGRDYEAIAVGAGVSIAGTFAGVPAIAVPVLTGDTTRVHRIEHRVRHRLAYGHDVRDRSSTRRPTSRWRPGPSRRSSPSERAPAGQVSPAVAGSAAVVDVDITTTAAISGNVHVVAGGSVLVLAEDDTIVYTIAGAVGIGIAGGGGAGALALTLITKTTSAVIGGGAFVDALGATSVAGVPTGAQNADGTFVDSNGNFPTATMRGVAVQAHSSERLVAVAGSVGAGLFVGIAGAVTVEVLNADALAAIEGGAEINQGTAGSANTLQSVNVSATDTVDSTVVAGAIGGGAAGIGASVDVEVIRNDVTALIIGATVSAADAVTVNALSRRTLSGNAISAAGGGFALAGGIVVFSVGGDFTSSYSANADGTGTPASASALSGGSSGNVLGSVGTQISSFMANLLPAPAAQSPTFLPSNVANDTITLGSDPGFHTGQAVVYQAGGGTPIAGLQDGNTYFVIVDPSDTHKIKLAATATDAQAGTALHIGPGSAAGTQTLLANPAVSATNAATATSPSSTLATATTATVAVGSGTTAAIDGNAGVTAETVAVNARAKTKLDALTGGIGGGGIGIGIGIAVVTLDADVSAYVGPGSTITSVGTGGSLSVEAQLDDTIDALGFAGAGAALVALGAAVAVISDEGDARALLGGRVGTDGSIIQSTGLGAASVAGDGFGSVSVEAVSSRLLNIATGSAGFAAGAGLGVAITVGTVTGETRALVGAHTTLGTLAAKVGAVTVLATGIVDVEPHDANAPMGIALSAGLLLGASAGVAVVTIGKSGVDLVVAEVGGSATINSHGAVQVNATSTLTANVVVGAGAIGFAALGGAYAGATIQGTTRAQIDEGATVRATTLTVKSVGTATATADLVLVVVGLVSGAGADSSAKVDADVVALIGPAPDGGTGTSTLVSTSGLIQVVAQSTQSASATADGGNGGAVTVGVLDADATTSSATTAGLGDGTNVPAAGGVSVNAETFGAPASGTVVMGSVGLVSIGITTVSATSTPHVSAFLGDNVAIGSATAPIVGDVTLVATGRGEADATGSIYGGGGISVAAPKATATDGPSVDAHIGTAGAVNPTMVYTAGSIKVTAELSKSGLTFDDTVQFVDVTNDTLTFSFPGVVDGTQVQYSAEDGISLFPVGSFPAIGGLNDGAVYTVLNAGVNLIRLGAIFSLSDIDPLRETITVPGGVGFHTGDCIVYDQRGLASILPSWQTADASTGCGNTDPTRQVFYIRVLNPQDPTTFKLYTTKAAALASDDAPSNANSTVTDGSGSHLTFGSALPAGFVVGAPVIYRAPATATFTTAVVDIVPFLSGDTSVVHDAGLHEIYLPGNTFATGDAVRYHALSGNAIGGLIDGVTYYVIAVGGGIIELADSYCHAVGGNADPGNCTDTHGTSDTSDDTPIPVTPIAITITSSNNDVHFLERALGGLEDGVTYYIVNTRTSDHSIQLAATRGGTPIALDGSHRPGPHDFGLVQVDLAVPVGSGQEAFYADLSSGLPAGGVPQRLLAPGGVSLSTVLPPTGDGKSSASAQGGTGGVFDNAFPTSSLSGTPTVTATIAAGTLSAGKDVELHSISAFDVSTYANASGGGGITIGEANATTDLGTAPTTSTVAASTKISAAGDVTIDASNDHTIAATADSFGGGPISAKIAYSYANLNNDVSVVIGGGASIDAGGSLIAHVDSETTGSTDSETYSVGVGAGADANNTNSPRGLHIGSSTDSADRSITIGAGAVLHANTVDLLAKTSKMDLTAKANATSYSPILLGVTTAFANAEVDVYANTVVHVLGGTTRTLITGVEGVDIEARNGGDVGDDLTINRLASRLSVSTIPPQEADANGTDSFSATVDLDASVTVFAGGRTGTGGDLFTSPPGLQLALYVDAHNGTITVNNKRDDSHGDNFFDHDQTATARSAPIRWDADVVVLGGQHGNPLLVVDANGKVVAINDVQLIDSVTHLAYTPGIGDSVDPHGDGSYTIADISNTDYADVLFEADDTIANQTFNGSGTPPWPVFDIRDNLTSVTIVDHSGLDMHVGKIDVVNDLNNGDAIIELISLHQFAQYPAGSNPTYVTIQFDLRSSLAPSLVDIEKLATAGDVELTKAINNPAGLTRIIDTTGSILSSGSPTVTTNILDIEATLGSIGAADAAGHLQVDLVQFLERPRVDGPSTSQVRTPVLTARAGVDIDLSLRGLDRVPGLGSPVLTVPIDLVKAGHDDNLILRTALRQPGSTTPAAVTAVVRFFEVSSTPDWSLGVQIQSHFRPDGGTQTHDPAGYTAALGSTDLGSLYVFQQRFALVPRVLEALGFTGVDHYAVKVVQGDFVTGGAALPAESPGLVAGHTIAIADAEGFADPTRLAADGGKPKISILGFTDLAQNGAGWLDVDVNGIVTLKEVAGDLRLGLVRSRTADVTLTAAGAILDTTFAGDSKAAEGDPQDVQGNNITLTALGGDIGTSSDFVETNLDDAIGGGNGVLNACAVHAVYIEEATGDLRIGVVTAFQPRPLPNPPKPPLDHATLTARDGSILDGANDTAADIVANTIDLKAWKSIGGSQNDLDINSAVGGPAAGGRLYAQAGGDIYITETEDELYVLAAISTGGLVRLSLPDTTRTRGPPTGAGNNSSTEDLVLLTSGTAVVDQGVTRTIVDNPGTTPEPIASRSGIWALGDISLWVGDDVSAPADTWIVAGGTIYIHGDVTRGPYTAASIDPDPNGSPAGTNVDTGGTVMTFAGTLGGVFDATHQTVLTRIFGNTEDDLITFDSTLLGAVTRVYGSDDLSATNEPAGDGQDSMIVRTLRSTPFHLTLDGQQGSDYYEVLTTGSQGDNRSYVVNVLDTGAAADGVDKLDVLGTDASADVFLLRGEYAIADETSVRPAFVSLLHNDVADAQCAANASPSCTRPSAVQRVNYDAGLDDLTGGVFVYGGGGNDTFAVDDTSAPVYLDGAAGADTFQIGQLYGSRRDGATVAANDRFPTTATTRGWLSNGISRPLTASGGDGNDVFAVYANKAKLTLQGNAGDDLFTVRAFALAQTTGNCVDITDLNCQIVWQGNPANRIAMPVLSGTQVQYVVNDAVSIDGGTGFDKTVALGTEFGDHLVVDATGVFGAGLTVTYSTIEALEVDGMEGDDTIDVVGTAAGISTRVIGGLGSDIIDVTGDVFPDVVSQKTFPKVPHLLSALAGPLAVEGGESGANRDLWLPLLLPGEKEDILFSIAAQADESQQVDLLSIFDDSDAAGHGTLAQTGLIGFGTAGPLSFAATNFGEPSTVPGGISFGGIRFVGGAFVTDPLLTTLEVVNLMLGPGHDDLTVTGSAVPGIDISTGVVARHGTLTVVQGGGGSDQITVTGGGGPGAPLVVYGDTSQDGLWYGGAANVLSFAVLITPKPFQNVVGSSNSFRVPIANTFATAGNDSVDAHVSGTTPGWTVGLTIYGGPGNDHLIGSQAGDFIAGGSGDDVLVGNGGTDQIYGDSGVNVDLITRTLTIPTTNTVVAPNADGLVAGADNISGSDGNDVIFGDHGIVGQDVGTATVGPSGYVLPTNPERIQTTLRIVTIQTDQPGNGVVDSISGGTGADRILGGNGGDTISGDDGDDLILGDQGYIHYATPDSGASLPDVITTCMDPNTGSCAQTIGGADAIDGAAGNDVIFGGTGGDTISGGLGNDLIFGDHGAVTGAIDTSLLPLHLAVALHPFSWTSIDTAASDGGSADLIRGNAGDDVIVGGQGADSILGDDGDDDIIGGQTGSLAALVLGSAVTIAARAGAGGSDTGDTIDAGAGNDWVEGDNGILLRTGSALSPRFRVLQGGTIFDLNGNDLVAPAWQNDPAGNEERYVELFDQSATPLPGTFGDDNIAGGSGDDVLFGQLGNDTIQGDGSTLDDTGATTIDVLTTRQSVEDYAGIGADGRDWIEGNGGGDTIFGDLGQDDLIGGSSDLYSLTSPAQRPDGGDIIFGGAGTRLERDNYGDLSGPGHAHDADTILGDNGDIFDLVSAGGGFLTFTYDNYSSSERIIPRAYRLLDYTPGNPTAVGTIGAADLIHGENGDDTIHGMTGDDVLFGEGQDDNIYGGTGNDRIYGGTGEDGILGDDGVILTSRNGQTEPLNGLLTKNVEFTAADSGPFTSADLYIPDALFKQAQLSVPDAGGNDVLYGGLGDDFMHGGAGDDGISGAEAEQQFYNEDPVVDTNPLQYDSNPASPNFSKFAAYNAVDPWSIIPNWFLNFDAYVIDEATGQPVDSNGQLVKSDDGRDSLYGDNGNDWIVGGTNCDWLFGGFGDDLLQLDDNLLTDGGKNDNPENDDPRFRDGDFAFGGAGRDVLIANTALDRMYDWGGEFNSFIVPFAPFGNPTVNREFSPAARALILALSLAGGEDTRLALQTPFDETALVTPADGQLWQDQHGAPRDPQPGNIGGVKRDDTGSGNLSCACSFSPAVHITKLLWSADGSIKGESAEAGTLGIVIPSGIGIWWTYEVTNVSQNPERIANPGLVITTLVDDNGTPSNPADDFHPVYVSGDANGNGVLDIGETWIFTSKGVPGATAVAPSTTLANTATVQARCVTTGVPGCVAGTTVADTAMNRVTGNGTGVVRVKKAINAVNPLAPTVAEEADAATGPVLAIDSPITWTYRVWTTGTVAVTVTVISDDNGTPNNAADDFIPVYVSGDTNQNGKVDPGEVWLYSAAGIATLGQYTNTVDVQATTSTGTTSSSTDTANYLGTTGLRIRKSVNAVDPLHPTVGEDADSSPGPSYPVGTQLTFTYLVYGDSQLPLTNVVVRDDNATPGNAADDFNAKYVSGDTNANGKLDYGEVWLFASTGATSQQLVLALGTFVDTATVTATNGTPVSASNVAWVTGAPVALHLVKSINAVDPAHPDYYEDANAAPGEDLTIGSTVTFTFAVSTTGLAPVANVAVTDAPALTVTAMLQTNGKNVGDTNSNGLLDPGEIWLFKATATAASGLHTDIGTATATDPLTGAHLTATDSANYTGVPVGIQIVKAVNAVNPAKPTASEDANNPSNPVLVAVGALVTWTYSVTNLSGTALSGIKVTDDNGTPTNTADDFVLTTPTSGDSNKNGLLDTGETWVFTAPTRPAVAGLYTNVATVQGTAGKTTYVDNDPASYFGWVAGLHIVKATNASDPSNPTALEQANAAPGQVLAIGTPVVWTYLVSNTGNIALAIGVRDNFGTSSTADDFTPKYVSGDTNGNGKLDMNEVWLFTSSSIVNYAVHAGQYVNDATASATAPDGSQVTSVASSYHFGGTGHMIVQKAVNAADPWHPTAYEDANYANGVVLPVGSSVTWTYLVTNNGDVAIDLTGVSDDGGLGSGIAFLAQPVSTTHPGFNDGDVNQNTMLDPGEMWLFSATGTVPDQSQPYHNVATATGAFRIAGVPFQVTATDGAYLQPTHVGIQIVKKVNGTFAETPGQTVFVTAGSPVTFTYLVMATTLTPIANVHVVDDNGTPGNPADDFSPTLTSGDANANGMLDPGETWTYTATRAVPAGRYANVALASGTAGGTIVYDDDLGYAFGVAPAISVVKAVNALDPLHPTSIERADSAWVELGIGGTATFTYLVRNTGNVPLVVSKTTAVLDDNGTPTNPADDFLAVYVSGDTNNDGLLDLSEAWLFRSSARTVTAGAYVNTGKVTGFETHTAQTVTASDTAGYFGRTGFEGLTPGFWKNNAGNKNAVAWPRDGNGNLIWDPGQAASTMFSALLTVGSPYASLSLADALGLGGGGLAALLRQAISAVLGATSPYVAYPLTAADVIAAVNAAILGGNATTITNLQNTLAGYNNAEADLDANGNIPTPTLSITSVTVPEGNSGATLTTLTVTLSGPAKGPVAVNWATVAGTATAGSDYSPGSGTLVFVPGGTMTLTIPISIVGDTSVEPDETFSVNLSSPTNATLAVAIGTVTIANDDGPAGPVVTVAATDAAGAEQASDPIVFSLTRSGSTSSALAVAVAWSGSATLGGDYTVTVTGGTLSGNTLTFASGSATATVTVKPVDDAVVEGAESVSLTLGLGAGYTVGAPGTASGSIADNDTAVSVAATDSAGAEQLKDPIVFTVTRTGIVSGSTIVGLGWSGTALPADYTVTASGATLGSNASTLTFAANATSATVTLTPVDDAVAEGAEGVTLTLKTGTGYSLGSPASASGTIADNDVAALSAGSASVTEGDKNTSTVNVSITLSNPSSQTITVVVTTMAGSAAAGSDFVSKTATVTFAPGATTATFAVSIVGDKVKESTETFTVVLSSPTGGATIASGTGTVTIVDNDGAMLAAAEAPAGAAATGLTAEVLAPVVARAEAMWRAILPGADFSGDTIAIGDLPGGQLGWTDGRLTTIDATAAGFGWWSGANAGGAGQMDLLTVVLHELGRLLGFTTDDAQRFPVMSAALAPGQRLGLTSGWIHPLRRGVIRPTAPVRLHTPSR